MRQRRQLLTLNRLHPAGKLPLHDVPDAQGRQRPTQLHPHSGGQSVRGAHIRAAQERALHLYVVNRQLCESQAREEETFSIHVYLMTLKIKISINNTGSYKN